MFSDLCHGNSADEPGGSGRCTDQLKQWCLSGERQTLEIKLEPWMTISLPHPSHFLKHVAYFDTLVWPRQPQIDDPGISWLELFIACVSATACRVPNQRGR